jgi:predicted RecA/RadA family phage recombinase
MAKATYVRGEKNPILYTAGADIAVDDIIVIHNGDAKAGRLCVALEDIPNTKTGYVATRGVWKFPKVSGAVIKAGECVTWDSDPGAIEDIAHSTGAGDIAFVAMAMEAGVNLQTKIDIDISHPGAYDAA